VRQLWRKPAAELPVGCLIFQMIFLLETTESNAAKSHSNNDNEGHKKNAIEIHRIVSSRMKPVQLGAVICTFSVVNLCNASGEVKIITR